MRDFRVWNICLKRYLTESEYWIYINSSHSCILFTEGFEFEQFTGKLDKNGVKIYEGDIVSGNAETGFVREKAKQGAYHIEYHPESMRYIIVDNLGNRVELFDLEVIGNMNEQDGWERNRDKT